MADETIKISGQTLQKMFDAQKDTLKQEFRDEFGEVIIQVETLKRLQETGASKGEIEKTEKALNEKLAAISGDLKQVMEDAQKNQKLIDELAAEKQKRATAKEQNEFKVVWQESVVNQMKEVKSKLETLKFGSDPIRFTLPVNNMRMEEKGIMTVSNTLTGTGMITFNDRQGLLPAQQINFRDILSTAPANDNGTYVTYRETSAVQLAGVQTDGSAKQNMQYTFSAQTATLKYIAGFATFTKQLLFNLYFLQNKLPQMLLRDFYKKENDYLFTQIASNSTGTSLPAGTSAKADVEEILQVIASQRGRNFDASYGIIDWTEWQRILATKPNDYSIPGGVIIDANGVIRIAGMPIIPASWAQTDHILVYDSYYYERVEGEALNVQISYENQDNFEKNQITMRVECFEEMNRLRDDASIYYDFGNS